MKGTFYFLVKPKEERYNNVKKIGDKELILNTEIFNHQYVSREAVVVGLPSEFNSVIELGDEVIIHHNVFRRWHDARGKERNSASYVKEGLYKVTIDQIYAYKRIVNWNALPGYTFVKPIKESLGVVEYSDVYDKGDVIGYNPIAEYEFLINEEKFYRVKNNFITIKYEPEAKEKEYNRSWLQSG